MPMNGETRNTNFPSNSYLEDFIAKYRKIVQQHKLPHPRRKLSFPSTISEFKDHWYGYFYSEPLLQYRLPKSHLAWGAPQTTMDTNGGQAEAKASHQSFASQGSSEKYPAPSRTPVYVAAPIRMYAFTSQCCGIFPPWCSPWPYQRRCHHEDLHFSLYDGINP